MNTTAHASREDWDRYDDQLDGELPRRPRRQFLNAWSALLLALVLGGAGFYTGVRLEKGQLSSSASSSGLAGALASRFGGARGGAATGASGTGTTAGGSSGATGRSGAGGFAGRFGGLGGLAGLGDLAAGAGQAGTVSSVAGNTIYLTEASGNTVKVKLTPATKITKQESVSKAKLNPGDTTVVSGITAKNGTITATSITDAGNRSGSSGASGSSTGAGGSSSSPLSSLFGG